ncbi:MAG: cytochrome-c peroxidase [Bacteroidetes bacterium]|nr:cytochrome-c peroxidase [Bacteroidota bacterium]
MKKFLFILPLLAVLSCKVDPKIVEILPTDNVKEIVPEGWPQPNYTFSVNVLSEDRFVLGRALFYEPMLSKDNTISCGSCHQQFSAFAHADHQFSHGFNDVNGTRNAPGIFNMNWHTSFMHDGGINHIEMQPIGPITNPIEMAEDINAVIAKH